MQVRYASGRGFRSRVAFALVALAVWWPAARGHAAPLPWLRHLRDAVPVRADVAARVDLAPYFPAPGDQGRQNSCVAWAVAYTRSYEEYVENLARGRDSSVTFSPSFIYNQINFGRDGGARIPDALALLARRGAAPLSQMPYREGDFRSRPSQAVLTSARRYRTHEWRRESTYDIGQLRADIAAGFPVIVAARVDSSFIRLRGGEVWSDTIAAGNRAHTMVAIGYDDARGAFKVINSWGPGWADGGYGWIDYRLVPVVVQEAYVDVEAPDGFAERTMPGAAVAPRRFSTR
jgi:C1A family cysteine protease